MYSVVEEKGDANVKIAVEVMRCIVASWMKCDLPSSSGSDGSVGSSVGSFGVERCGARSVIGNMDSRLPRAGCEGIVPL